MQRSSARQSKNIPFSVCRRQGDSSLPSGCTQQPSEITRQGRGKSAEKEPEKRLAHKTLAKEIVTFLHGEEAYEEALNITNSLFSGNIKNLSSKEIMQAFKGLEAYEINEAKNIIDLLVESSICSSKREAREFVQNGSIYINGEKTNDLETIIDKNVAIDNKYIIIRRGKKKYFMVAFND